MLSQFYNAYALYLRKVVDPPTFVAARFIVLWSLTPYGKRAWRDKEKILSQTCS